MPIATHRRNWIPLSTLAAGLLIIGFHLQSCRPAKAPGLVEHFTSVKLSDTLHIDSERMEVGKTQPIPQSDFFTSLDSSLIGAMIYPPDTTEMELYGHWKAPINDRFEACLLEVQEHWFVFKYLLVYSKAEQQFTSLVPVAHFYGGEGGQIRTESRLFDWRSKKTAKILTRESAHTLRMLEEEVKDTYEESVMLRQWRQGQFEEIPVRDSSSLIEKFPVEW